LKYTARVRNGCRGSAGSTFDRCSEASIVPQQVKAMGWSLKEFYTKLVEECF